MQQAGSRPESPCVLQREMPEREWYFPLVHEGRRLSFHRVCHGGEFVTGSWDIREPGPACPELHAGELDLIVLPGAAFTRDGRRLGYGGGFYDTLLAGATLRWPAFASPASFWTICLWNRTTKRRTWSSPPAWSNAHSCVFRNIPQKPVCGSANGRENGNSPERAGRPEK